MIIKTNQIKSNDVAGVIQELYAMPEFMDFIRGQNLTGDTIEAMATDMVYDDVDIDTDVYLPTQAPTTLDDVDIDTNDYLPQAQTAFTKLFARKTDDGNYLIAYVADGAPVTKLDINIYPVESNMSAKYEHPEGIILTEEDVKKLGIIIE